MDWGKLANKKELQKTKESLEGKGYEVVLAKDKKEALDVIKTSIPDGASVMNGSSVTLEQIGYVDYLTSGKHKWVDWHAKINAEKDKAKRDKLRRESVLSDYYLGSVHGLSQNGEFVVASNTGSQLPHVVFTSPNLIFVVSTKKITLDIDSALKRLNEHVLPLEDDHMLEKFNMHTTMNKVVISYGEAPMIGRKIKFILVEEDLGF